MRKLILTIGAILATGSALTYIPTIMTAEQQAPSYAKWGKVAMEHVKSTYPKAAIIDYLHVGREVKSEKTTEIFKLWLREGDREFGVFLHITFLTKSEEILEIKEKKTNN